MRIREVAVREGKSHGGYDQGNTNQKERQGDHAPTTRAPQVNVEPVEPPSEFDAFGNCEHKKKPEVCDQHTYEGGSNRNKSRYIFPNLNTPEWITAISAVAATVVAICALGVSIVSCSVTQSQLDEMKSGADQTNTMVAAASTQAGATKIIAESAQSSLLIGQRAWLGTTQAAFPDGVMVGGKIIPLIYFRNTGKSPARFVNVDMDIRIRPNERGKLSEETKKIIINDANACLAKNYGTVGAVVFPEAPYSYKYEAEGRDTGIPAYDIEFTDRMISGRDVVIVNGCINYKTMGINAHTAFCFYYEAGRTMTDVLNICRVGNQAD